MGFNPIDGGRRLCDHAVALLFTHAARSGAEILNKKTINWSGRYLEALRVRLQRGAGRTLRVAHKLGREAVALGLETLDLAKIHEEALMALTPADCIPRQLVEIRRRSTLFFLETLTPVEESNRHLKREIVRREKAEAALIESEQHHRVMLKQALVMEQRLRQLSHRLLSAQEEERKKISRELHDQIAQMLAGINVHLATFKGAALIGAVGLNQKIRSTQRMVEKSVRTVHRFARELRPPVLDDLWVIPAVQSYLKHFTERTGILVNFTVSASIEELHGDKRTVLYRVVQAALTNIGQHAKSTRIDLAMTTVDGVVEMTIRDNGCGFDVDRVLFSRKNKRLGVIGMRERVEMVGGKFNITSITGEGTAIMVRIPVASARRAARP